MMVLQAASTHCIYWLTTHTWNISDIRTNQSHVLLLLVVLLLILLLRLLRRLSVLLLVSSLLLLLIGRLLMLVCLLLSLVILLLLGVATRCLTCMLVATTAVRALTAHLLIVGLMLRQDLLSHFFLSLMDVGVKLVAVLFNRELLIIVDRDKDFLRTHGLLLFVVELRHIRMLQSLLSRQPLVGIELQKVLEQVECLLRRSWKHVPQFLCLRRRKTLEHCLSEGTVDGFDVLLAGSARHFHYPI